MYFLKFDFFSEILVNLLNCSKSYRTEYVSTDVDHLPATNYSNNSPVTLIRNYSVQVITLPEIYFFFTNATLINVDIKSIKNKNRSHRCESQP